MVHYIVPAPVPVIHAPIMDSRHQLASMANALNRRLRTEPSYDPHSRTYGCRISEPRMASNGAPVMVVIAETFGHPNRDVAEVHAASSALHALSANATDMAISVYGATYR
ncbi:hypothetical protein M408DRAFT_150527 [Serendipita vermifera MAFF 305830]|uniref:Uncharacterized protein n=1 Tax=Serendipita vermifera MAFF 305830 TaxID=933852 RepID=A0A0C3B8R4_SERVB|nr:hypothetical protein M408DRAFT_150527 [Serendipita vermifera MAFF 305830]